MKAYIRNDRLGHGRNERDQIQTHDGWRRFQRIQPHAGENSLLHLLGWRDEAGTRGRKQENRKAVAVTAFAILRAGGRADHQNRHHRDVRLGFGIGGEKVNTRSACSNVLKYSADASTNQPRKF